MVIRCAVVAISSLFMSSDCLAAGIGKASPQFELTIGGEKHLVTEGSPSRVSVGGRQTTVLLRRVQLQLLSFDGFSFSYPNGFSQLGSKSGGSTAAASWMIKGRSCQLTVHRKDKGTSLKFLADHMGKFYESLDAAQDVRRESASIHMSGRNVAGVRFLMNSRGEGLNYQDYFQLPVSSTRYNYFLVVHAKPGNREAEQAKKLLGSSLR